MVSMKIFVVLGAALLAAYYSEASIVDTLRMKRNSLKDNAAAETNPSIICDASTPCGWMLYKQYTKELDYFIKNTYCKCNAVLKCVRMYDDPKAGAYVHYCREKEPDRVL